MSPTLNRILILGWPFVAVLIMVPVLKAVESPPSLTVAVLAIIGTIAGGLIGSKLDIPEKWLETEEEREEKRSRRRSSAPD